jgi:hypothetical protein
MFMPDNQASGAIFTPQAGLLTALRSFAAVKAGLIPLGLLNCPYEFGLFCLTGLDVVPLGDLLDLVEFHDLLSPLSCD